MSCTQRELIALAYPPESRAQVRQSPLLDDEEGEEGEQQPNGVAEAAVAPALVSHQPKAAAASAKGKGGGGGVSDSADTSGASAGLGKVAYAAPASLHRFIHPSAFPLPSRTFSASLLSAGRSWTYAWAAS